MLHLDSDFTDSSDSVQIVTAGGDAQISTSQSRFGGCSAYFDGSGDYLIVNDNDDWYMGTDKFTIDFWARFDSLTSHSGLFGQFDDASNHVRFEWIRSMNGHIDEFRLSKGVARWIFNFTPPKWSYIR